MPKKVLIFLVLAVLIVAFMFLGMSRHKISTGLLLSRAKPKKVVIQELETSSEHRTFKTSDMEGHWVFFIHFPDRTLAFDMFMDRNGKIIRSNRSGMAGALFVVDSRGKVHASAPGLVIDGVLGASTSYMRGVIKEKRRRGPLWFSACKVSGENACR